MPRDLKGEKRPADVIGNAITIARIAVGENIITEDGKNAATMALGRVGQQSAGGWHDRRKAVRDSQEDG